MKKLVLASAVVATVFAVPATADSPRDSVTGAQKVTQPSGFQHVNVSAHSGPTGENPQGQVHATFDSPFLGAAALKGRVVCLNVSGTLAHVAALLDEPYNGNTHVTLIIQEGGHPVMGQSADSAFIGFTSSPPPNCANSGSTLLGKATGNLVVHDAS